MPPVVPTAASNRTSLYQRTLVHHERAETYWTELGFLLNRDVYEQFLSGLFDVHTSLGAAAAAALGPETVKLERERRVALIADLQGVPANDQEYLPLSKSAAWGTLYVLNGSSIGASLLLRTNKIPNIWPQAYLQAMRRFAKDGSLSEFFAALDIQTLDMEQASTAAKAVFDRVARLPTTVTLMKAVS